MDDFARNHYSNAATVPPPRGDISANAEFGVGVEDLADESDSDTGQFRSNDYQPDPSHLRPPTYEDDCRQQQAKSKTKTKAKAAEPEAESSDVEPPKEDPPELNAKRFDNAIASIYLGNIVDPGLPGLGDPKVMKSYLEDFTAKSKAQEDPLQRLLAEQILVAYHRLGSLHCSSAKSKSPELMISYNAAATKLHKELRQSIVALRELQAIRTDRVTQQPPENA